MTRVEHPHGVAVLAQDWRQRFNPQRREPHHLDARLARFGAAHVFRQQPVEIRIANINKKDQHERFC